MIRKKYCEDCFDGNDVTVFPYYGTAPHTHYKHNGVLIGTAFASPEEWPENFEPDPEAEGYGTYTHCLNCGADGSFTLPGEILESLKDVA